MSSREVVLTIWIILGSMAVRLRKPLPTARASGIWLPPSARRSGERWKKDDKEKRAALPLVPGRILHKRRQPHAGGLLPGTRYAGGVQARGAVHSIHKEGGDPECRPAVSPARAAFTCGPWVLLRHRRRSATTTWTPARSEAVRLRIAAGTSPGRAAFVRRCHSSHSKSVHRPKASLRDWPARRWPPA